MHVLCYWSKTLIDFQLCALLSQIDEMQLKRTFHVLEDGEDLSNTYES